MFSVTERSGELFLVMHKDNNWELIGCKISHTLRIDDDLDYGGVRITIDEENQDSKFEIELQNNPTTIQVTHGKTEVVVHPNYRWQPDIIKPVLEFRDKMACVLFTLPISSMTFTVEEIVGNYFT